MYNTQENIITDNVATVTDDYLYTENLHKVNKLDYISIVFKIVKKNNNLNNFIMSLL